MTGAMPLVLAASGEDSGIRFIVLLLLAVPAVFWPLEAWIRKHSPNKGEDDEEPRGRDYYLGFTVGQHLRAVDQDDLLRLLRTESYPIQLHEDKGGEKVFTCRNLPATRTHKHDLEAGLLAGGLFKSTGTRFEVEEERCAARGQGYCKFVAIKG